jgi:hypothetical protein
VDGIHRTVIVPSASDRPVKRRQVLLVLVASLLCGATSSQASDARTGDWTIRDGKLHVDGTWVFLKIGKPLRNFADPAACQALADTLDVDGG